MCNSGFFLEASLTNAREINQKRKHMAQSASVLTTKGNYPTAPFAHVPPGRSSFSGEANSLGEFACREKLQPPRPDVRKPDRGESTPCRAKLQHKRQPVCSHLPGRSSFPGRQTRLASLSVGKSYSSLGSFPSLLFQTREATQNSNVKDVGKLGRREATSCLQTNSQ